MASPRIRRLASDYELLQRVLRSSPLIEISGTAGMPPEIYRFTYKLKGLYVAPSREILERGAHVLEVNLSLDYPRRAPQCRMLTRIFHPNFDDASVCIGDFWAASEGFDDLLFRIGRMIAYQEYNTKSPLNGLAAKWAAEHTHMLPIDARVIGSSSISAAADTEPSNVEAKVLQPLFVQTPQNAGQPVRTGESDPWSTKITIVEELQTDTVCPTCDMPYNLDDYRADAPKIFCSHCRTELPRSSRPKQA